jgi:hypothetical protein
LIAFPDRARKILKRGTNLKADAQAFEFEENALRLLTTAQAHSLGVIPIKHDEEALLVCVHPQCISNVDDVAFLTGLPINVRVATEDSFYRVLSKYFPTTNKVLPNSSILEAADLSEDELSMREKLYFLVKDAVIRRRDRLCVQYPWKVSFETANSSFIEIRNDEVIDRIGLHQKFLYAVSKLVSSHNTVVLFGDHIYVITVTLPNTDIIINIVKQGINRESSEV